MVDVTNPDDPNYERLDKFQLAPYDYASFAKAYNKAEQGAILTVSKSKSSQTSVINAMKRRGLVNTVDFQTYQDKENVYVKKFAGTEMQER